MGLCPNHPIEQVSWSEMQEFIKVLNGIGDGYVYRFPTEAEWEYAARGGTQTAYFFGNDARKLSDYGWYKENSGGQTHAVGEKRANQFGLYDIYGNVWEWVQDWYGEYPVGNQRDPSGSASGPGRVVRGGRWLSIAECLRSADRFFVDPREGRSSLGFRLVRVRK